MWEPNRQIGHFHTEMKWVFLKKYSIQDIIGANDQEEI